MQYPGAFTVRHATRFFPGASCMFVYVQRDVMEDKILPRHGFLKLINRPFQQRILFCLFVFLKITFVSSKKRSVED